MITKEEAIAKLDIMRLGLKNTLTNLKNSKDISNPDDLTKKELWVMASYPDKIEALDMAIKALGGE